MSNKLSEELRKINVPKSLHNRIKMGVAQAKAEETGAHTRFKWSAVFILTALLISIGMIFFLNDDKQNVAIPPPEQEYQEEVAGGIEGEIQVYNFYDSIIAANLIAEVTIKEKLEEVDSTIPYTLFSAVIEDVFKGEPKGKEVIIKQEGTSKVSFNDNKLFEPGEKYILFLRETTTGIKADYWILGEETGMYGVINDQAILKLAYPLEELKDIMVTDQSVYESEFYEAYRNKSPQPLNKEKFIEKIRGIVVE